MATPQSPSLKRARALRSHRHTPVSQRGTVSPSPGPRRGSVTFDTQASVYQPDLLMESALNEKTEDDEVGTRVGYSKCFPCHYLIERKSVRRFFRVLAVFNLLSLIFSAPLKTCDAKEKTIETCRSVFIQFVFIACVDFVLAVLYTIQTLLRIEYSIHLRKNPQAVVRFESDGTPKKNLEDYTSLYRLISNSFITLCLWYSFALGVYRSIRLDADPIFWAYYIPFAFRSIGTLTAMKLFVHLKLQSAAALSGLLGRIKWKQLGIVIIFYVIFIYMFALFGVQWIGGLNERCTYSNSTSNTTLLSIPLTHCTDDFNTPLKNCYNDENMECGAFPNGSMALNINYRDDVYLGQFRVILDSIYAVYEASSLELWFFMESAAQGGAPRNGPVTWFFYLVLVFFLVIFVQQSIFLVVIIESFADLRSDSDTSDSSTDKKDKPAIVLYEQPGTGDDKDKLRFKTLKNQESTAKFREALKKYYFHGIEKFFITVVLIDSIIVATRHTGMCDTWSDVIKYWQIGVSILFVFEITGLFLVHVFTSPNQLKLFSRTYYFWYLLLVAVAGLVASPFYKPGEFSLVNAVAIFQAMRFFRILRLIPSVKRFFFKIIGNGVKLAVVIFIVLVFMGWFAIVSIQLFGYLQPADEQCGRFGTEQFRDIIHALQSMFQLIMQEGWTELTSEIMCHRGWPWVLINFYFILLHLFASLILLNFFVAVILDNLDYDEETKTERLVKELNTRKVERVPRHLKVFKWSGPKRIPVPKLSSVDVPNLTETDVRNFYNIGENTDFPTTYVPEHLPSVTDSYFQRRTSEFSNLDLLTEDKSVSSSIQSHQGKYIGIQGILSYVKAFRQYSRERESAKRGQETSKAAARLNFWVVGTQGDSSQLIQSEYDEYREKYRLFDSALFCMPPENKFRKTVKAFLTYQCADPDSSQLKRGKGWSFELIKSRLSYGIRYFVSRLPYFGWAMLFITLATIGALMYEVYTDDATKKNPTYLWVIDLIFVLSTLTELILKILANGLFFNPNAAIASVWDVLDWIIVLATLAVMGIFLNFCGPSLDFAISLGNTTWWMQALLFCRILRPLRLISLIPSMRRVVFDVVLGWKNIILGGILLVFFMFFFASLGVQLFAGEGSSEAFCNDPNIKNEMDCVGHFMINIEISPQELLPTGENDVFVTVPRVWYKHRRDFRFDNTAHAMLTLFEVLTLEGWLDVRDLFGSINTETDINWLAVYMNIYIHIFIFFGVNILLQLFVGIVVNNFNEHKPDHSALLTVSQKRWTDLIQRISLTRPIKRPPAPVNNKLRLLLYKVFVSSRYRHFLTAIIVVNSTILWVPWVETTNEAHNDAAKGLMSVFIGFAVFYILELVLKLAAFGPLQYFKSGRNIFDFLVALLALCYIVCAIVYLVRGAELIKLTQVADIALVLSVLKLFTVLMRYSSLQNLLITVGQTVYRGLSLIGVLVVTIATYSLVSTLFFNTLRSGEAVNYALINFNGLFTSITLFIRIMTGEDWHHLLWDAMVGHPYCSDEYGNCGNTFVAIFWFISYYLIVTFILLNVVIAVLLENFSIFYNEDDTELSHAVVKDFKQNWLFFDKRATGFIQSNKIKLFLRMLRLEQFFTYQINENGVKERQKCDILVDPLLLREMAEELQRNPKQQGVKPDQSLLQRQQLGEEPDKENHSFQDVLKMVAYRAENISKRLVPHELYTREELEESVQFDVAEDCILKWIQRFVDPVIKRQEIRRRPTLYHQPSGLRNYAERSVLWDSPEIEGNEDEYSDDLPPSASEDESEINNLPLVSLSQAQLRSHLRSQPSEAKSDDEVDSSDPKDKSNNPALAKSFARIERAPFVHFKQGTEDKWHNWFKMQKEWMNNVENDPENYFDDYL